VSGRSLVVCGDSALREGIATVVALLLREGAGASQARAGTRGLVRRQASRG